MWAWIFELCILFKRLNSFLPKCHLLVKIKHRKHIVLMYCYDISNFAQKLLSKMHLSKYYKDTKRNLKPGAKSFEKWYLYNFVEWGSSIMFSKLCILKVVHVSAPRASFSKGGGKTPFINFFFKVWSCFDSTGRLTNPQ